MKTKYEIKMNFGKGRMQYPITIPAGTRVSPTGDGQFFGTCGLCWHSRRRIAFLQH